MRAASSDRVPASHSPPLELSVSRRLALVLCGYIPLLHVSAVVATAALPWMKITPLWTIVLCPVVLYLVPPLVVRLAFASRTQPEGEFSLESREMIIWWFSAQWQIVFNRLTFLEELLRLIPGVYSTWLRLWGGKVGTLVFWSPGCRISDRQLVEIGSRVVIGAGARLHAHVLSRRAFGTPGLLVAPIRIGNDALIGGMSNLFAGSTRLRR